MTGITRVVVAASSVVLLALPCSAQNPASNVVDWGHGTAVSATGGAAWASPTTGAVAGGALGWEITPRVMIEGSGLWLNREQGVESFNAALKLRAGIRQAGVSPFVEGGFGLYRTTTSDAASLPEFYRSRLSSAPGAMTSVAFTDPSFHFGGGLNVFLSRHIAVQPAVEAIVVVGDGKSYTLGIASVRLTYHFEDHPVTPQRR